MEKKLEDIKLGFLPLPLFVILAVILVVAELTGKMTVNLYTGALVCALFGCAMRFVVDHVPIIEKTIGGAFVALSCATFVYFNLVPEDWIEACKIFIDGDIDFLTCYVITLICGTILTMDRKVLIKVGIRYFIPIFGGLVFAYGLGAAAGQVLGIGWKHAIMYIAGPIMGGGNGAGAVPMSEIYSSVNGADKAVIYSELHAMTTLGNWISIFFAIILNVVGQKRSETTGNGEIMRGLEVKAGKLEYDYKFDFSDLLTGAAIAAGVLLFGRICSKFVPAVHAYAFSIGIVVLCKVLNIVPKKWEYCSHMLYQLVGKKCMVILMGGLGIAMFNLKALIGALTPMNLLICTIVVIGGIIGAWIFGKLVGFYPVESAITAGLCMSNSGGNGDVYVLTSANRMELMPFSQISSRLGGAIVLVIQSILATILL